MYRTFFLSTTYFGPRTRSSHPAPLSSQNRLNAAGASANPPPPPRRLLLLPPRPSACRGPAAVAAGSLLPPARPVEVFRGAAKEAPLPLPERAAALEEEELPLSLLVAVPPDQRRAVERMNAAPTRPASCLHRYRKHRPRTTRIADSSK